MKKIEPRRLKGFRDYPPALMALRNQVIDVVRAEARLAAFLISLSGRFARRGLSATRFQLSMSRGEIANYLGLAVETVSRLLARFQQDGLLAVDGRAVTVLDLARLHDIAEVSTQMHPAHRCREH